MTTLAHEIALRIANSSPITTAQPSGLGFLVLERWPSPEGPGSTPEAFDPARGNRLKRTIVVLGAGEVSNPARQPFNLRRWDSFPTMYLFAEAHANGKEAIQSAYYSIETLLIGWEAIVAGQHITFMTDSWTDIGDDETFPGNVRAMCTFRATSTRRIVPAA